MSKKPVVLLILDGWGIRTGGPGNAIEEAHAKNYQALLSTYPWRAIEASGRPVGLPDGQMGNSEVGHMNMGAGRIVYQDLTKIDKAIEDGDFFENKVFLEAIAHAKQNNGTLHLMGLVSDGGVHSHISHLIALLDLAKEQDFMNVRVHAFLDGRDVPPKSAEDYLMPLEEVLLDEGFPQVTTISGRYYAMDRDNRWDRVEKAYHNLVMSSGRRHPLSLNALSRSYIEEIYDEFVEPQVTDFTYEGMKNGDSILFFNFRPDRAREITRAFVDKEFTGFERQKVLSNLYFGCMSPYDETLHLPVAFPKDDLKRVLAEIVSEHGLKQFHVAETEKYAHVTFFFNGGQEKPFPGEDRLLIPSPKVATYDLQPEMSLKGVTEGLVSAIESNEYAFIVANFANPDMVGHTGKWNPAISAVKDVDVAIQQVVEAVLKTDGVMLLTADHGNIETMLDEHGGEHTAHTTLPVPLVMISADSSLKLKQSGEYGLSSIAPLVLDLLRLPIPIEMTSPSLLVLSGNSQKLPVS
ncbi:MAG: 2,3-bisphosphoglycerate-independent phosphoglycerate mutase [Cyanobacteria bacterium]|nr:2,3-bisphosphoglycerate-independent phosphoglycerate mutase [Cyanobacteriota bacterium]